MINMPKILFIHYTMLKCVQDTHLILVILTRGKSYNYIFLYGQWLNKLYIENLTNIQKTLMGNIEDHTVLPTHLPKKCIYVIHSNFLVES